MNGFSQPVDALSTRADEVSALLDALNSLIIPFIRTADEAASLRATGRANQNGQGLPEVSSLVDRQKPDDLFELLRLSLPTEAGQGKEGLLQTIQRILRYSVNTWDQGFLDKLYASTNAVGVVSEVLLAVLNTNVHVYQVSPALTVIEKHTAREFARLFGFTGARAGGFTTQGGSASNLTSIVVARNMLYPETKTQGNASHKFILFTSEHGHYSIEKAAVACGLGSASVWTVPVDDEGRMIPERLRELVCQARAGGKAPLYVNATAGTTVLGSFDPLEEVAAVCREVGPLWLHVDASWGGSVVFSPRHRHKLAGAHLANSLAVNPHKMMNVPITCSFLLGPDVDVLHRANTLPAAYLFHGGTDSVVLNGAGGDSTNLANASTSGSEVWDQADLTLQCGRRGDSLKLTLAWIYHGQAGLAAQIDGAFAMAAYLASELAQRLDFVLVSTFPPPCLQVCFYHAPGGVLASESVVNTARTREMIRKLVDRGFMVDYAPGGRGSFFRVVVNCQTLRGTVDGLVTALEEVGREVC